MLTAQQRAEQVILQHEGHALVFFGGYDYHRLSRHPEVIASHNAAALEFGLSTGGSRATTGTCALHEQLERELAAFLSTEAAAVTTSGYVANLVAVQAAADFADVAILDDAAHASLHDAAAACALPLRQFRHTDLAGLASLMLDVAWPLVVTDGVFGATGNTPPLREYAAVVAAHGGSLLIDDCHGFGVMGATGKGSWEAFGLSCKTILQTGSLAKALGASGGLVAGNATFVERCRRSPAYIGSSALPPPACAAALASLRLLRAHPEWIEGLQQRAIRAKLRIRAFGIDTPLTVAPVISVPVTGEVMKTKLRMTLLANGIFPTFTNYPGAPAGGHYRFALSSAHTDEQIERLIAAIGMGRA